MGKLSLALRPLAESADGLDAAIASGAVNVPANGGSAAEKKMMAELANRPTASRSSATTGGEVSRFWIPVRGRVSQPRGDVSGGSMPSAGGGAMPAAPSGPVFRVTRGEKVTEVPVGGK